MTALRKCSVSKGQVTLAFGDPLNHPDLTGQTTCNGSIIGALPGIGIIAIGNGSLDPAIALSMRNTAMLRALRAAQLAAGEEEAAAATAAEISGSELATFALEVPAFGFLILGLFLIFHQAYQGPCPKQSKIIGIPGAAFA